MSEKILLASAKYSIYLSESFVMWCQTLTQDYGDAKVPECARNSGAGVLARLSDEFAEQLRESAQLLFTGFCIAHDVPMEDVPSVRISEIREGSLIIDLCLEITRDTETIRDAAITALAAAKLIGEIPGVLEGFGKIWRFASTVIAKRVMSVFERQSEEKGVNPPPADSVSTDVDTDHSGLHGYLSPEGEAKHDMDASRQVIDLLAKIRDLICDNAVVLEKGAADQKRAVEILEGVERRGWRQWFIRFCFVLMLLAALTGGFWIQHMALNSIDTTLKKVRESQEMLNGAIEENTETTLATGILVEAMAKKTREDKAP